MDDVLPRMSSCTNCHIHVAYGVELCTRCRSEQPERRPGFTPREEMPEFEALWTRDAYGRPIDLDVGSRRALRPQDREDGATHHTARAVRDG